MAVRAKSKSAKQTHGPEARPAATRTVTLSYTGKEFLASLDDDNVLTMPTDWGGFTHRYFRAPTTVEEQVAGRDARAEYDLDGWTVKDLVTPRPFDSLG